MNDKAVKAVLQVKNSRKFNTKNKIGGKIHESH